jgi:hypothetical protein
MLHNFANVIRELQRTFSDAVNPYRPELYYMRGPGPAYRAKRAGIAMSAVLVRIDSAPALAALANVHA